ncbi:MAG: hypothetical protein LBM96_04535 [Methanobrevibacter sp.]|jgi:hypothetical protein|nr:hypothetical protein [Candidatus Methanoflexus mossambicus]
MINATLLQGLLIIEIIGIIIAIIALILTYKKENKKNKESQIYWDDIKTTEIEEKRYMFEENENETWKRLSKQNKVKNTQSEIIPLIKDENSFKKQERKTSNQNFQENTGVSDILETDKEDKIEQKVGDKIVSISLKDPEEKELTETNNNKINENKINENIDENNTTNTKLDKKIDNKRDNPLKNNLNNDNGNINGNDTNLNIHNNENYDFVSKHWEEERTVKEIDEDNLYTPFHEPIQSKHQDIISNNFNDKKVYAKKVDDGNYSVTIENNSNKLDNIDRNIINNDVNTDKDNTNINSYSNTKSNIKTNNNINDKKFNSNNTHTINLDDFNNNKSIKTKNIGFNENKNENKNEHRNARKNQQKREKVAIGDKKEITVGTYIIFTFKGDSYMSRVYEINNNDLKVKYKGSFKWIDVKNLKKIM